jgi:predicted protein tyrosine phosphatase
LRLIVCPLAQLDAALALAPSHVMSLVSPETVLPLVPGQRLVLRFHDIAEPAEGLIAVQAEDIAAIIGFIQDWPGAAPLLIHCWAGISRSTAAAYIAACLREGAGEEERLAQVLRHAAPWATPNPRMVALADGILGRSGRMVRAIAGIGRGREAGMGELFGIEVGGRK